VNAIRLRRYQIQMEPILINISLNVQVKMFIHWQNCQYILELIQTSQNDLNIRWLDNKNIKSDVQVTDIKGVPHTPQAGEAAGKLWCNLHPPSQPGVKQRDQDTFSTRLQRPYSTTLISFIVHYNVSQGGDLVLNDPFQPHLWNWTRLLWLLHATVNQLTFRNESRKVE